MSGAPQLEDDAREVLRAIVAADDALTAEALRLEASAEGIDYRIATRLNGALDAAIERGRLLLAGGSEEGC
jgi:hypothetical protein